MSWLRFNPMVLVAGLSAAMALPSTAVRAADEIEFEGIRLGMSEAQALAHINTIAPGAFVGPLCTGNRGVGSYMTRRGLDWQIMAHTTDDTVSEIRLFRFDRTGTKTEAECTARFTELLAEQKAAYPDAQWTETDRSGGRYKIKWEVRAAITKTTSVQLNVARLDWDQARCSIDLRIFGPDPRRKRLSQRAPAE